MSQVEPKHSPIAEFDSEAVGVLRELRKSCAAILGSCGGVERAIHLTTRLGLDRSLGWKVWHIAQGVGTCPSAAHIPGRQGFKQFLDAANRLGVQPELLGSAMHAFERFRNLTSTYAGDRASADILLGPLSEEGRTRFELAMRRDGFRSQSHFLGVQTQTAYQLDVVLPPREGFMPDVARVRGFFGLRRNRADVSWIIARTTLVHSDGPSATLHRKPLGDNTDNPLLLTRFCSQPSLPIRRRLLAGVTAEDELMPGSVGQLAALDIVTAELISNMPRREVRTDATLMHVVTPAERLCYDVLLPRDVATPTVRVHSTMQGEHPYLRDETFGTIPTYESLEALGQADGAPVSPDVPRQRELLEWLLAELGIRAADFMLWRFRMRFPPIPACIGLRYNVPQCSSGD